MKETIPRRHSPRRAMKTAAATAWAALTPSGWPWETTALASAASRTSSIDWKAHPTGLTRMAEPFPQLSFHSIPPERIQERKRELKPASK